MPPWTRPPTTVEADDRRHDARRGRDEEGGAVDRPVGGVSDPEDLDRDLSGAGHGDTRPSLVVHESRAPILVALLVAMALPFLMPANYSPGARWLLPLVEGALLVAALSVDPGGVDRRSGHIRRLRIAMVMIIAFGAAWATSWLAVDLVQGENVTDSAGELLAAGSLVWIDLVIAFAFVYWELDGGGPGRRSRRAPRYPDLAFPQHLNPDVAPPDGRDAARPLGQAHDGARVGRLARHSRPGDRGGRSTSSPRRPEALTGFHPVRAMRARA